MKYVLLDRKSSLYLSAGNVVTSPTTSKVKFGTRFPKVVTGKPSITI